jgi:hypothetical protein
MILNVSISVDFYPKLYLAIHHSWSVAFCRSASQGSRWARWWDPGMVVITRDTGEYHEIMGI